MLPPSLIEQAIYIIKELGIDADAPSPHQYGKLVANMAMLKMNCKPGAAPELWEQLIDFLMYPDHRTFPDDLFMQPQADIRHLALALEAIEEIYDAHGS